LASPAIAKENLRSQLNPVEYEKLRQLDFGSLSGIKSRKLVWLDNLVSFSYTLKVHHPVAGASSGYEPPGRSSEQGVIDSGS
jgi:hypothetical protein